MEIALETEPKDPGDVRAESNGGFLPIHCLTREKAELVWSVMQ